MNFTPYDLYKQAVDALVPGQVGAGANPGTTGQMDSDPNEATNTNLALQRFAQAQAPVLSNTDADGGAGYAHPAPGLMPGMQMHADVKAASIIEEAQAFAEHVYLLNKQASAKDMAYNAAKKTYGVVAGAAPAFVERHPGAAAAAVGGAAALGYGAYRGAKALAEHGPDMVQGAKAMAQRVPGMAADAVSAVRSRLPGAAAGQLPTHAEPTGLAQMGQQVQEHIGRAQAYAAQHAGQLRDQASSAITNAANYTQQGMRNAANQAKQFQAQHPIAAPAIGAGALAAAGGAGYMAYQNSKEASLNEAAEMGRQFALQQIAQGNVQF